MTTDYKTILRKLESVAVTDFDGHLTIMRFTTNWRVGFGTPLGYDDVQGLFDGATFEEAAAAALAAAEGADVGDIDAKQEARVQTYIEARQKRSKEWEAGATRPESR